MFPLYLPSPFLHADCSRHYVAFVKKNIPGESQGAWVLFNDEKVAQAVDADEMKKFAYVYFLRRA